jgi:hypothetical protein
LCCGAVLARVLVPSQAGGSGVWERLACLVGDGLWR